MIDTCARMRADVQEQYRLMSVSIAVVAVEGTCRRDVGRRSWGARAGSRSRSAASGPKCHLAGEEAGAGKWITSAHLRRSRPYWCRIGGGGAARPRDLARVEPYEPCGGVDRGRVLVSLGPRNE